MRVPNTAEFLTVFAAFGQFSGLSRLPGADSEFSLAQACDRSYTVKSGDICNSIAEQNNAPTFQIMCQNEQIDGKCSNLSVDEDICLGLKGEDCTETYVVQWPDTALTISQKFNIPFDTFLDNNYCYYTGAGRGRNCPPFNDGTVVCIAPHPVAKIVPQKCAKLFT